MSQPGEGDGASSSIAGSGSRSVRLLDGGLDAVLALTVAVASLTILAQVVLRYGLNNPIAWADEFAVLVFAWMVFVGAAVVQRTDSHISMDTLVRLFSGRVRLALDLLRLAAIAFVLVVLLVQGFALAERFAGVRYPAMGISRAFLYAALPICVPLMLFYLALNLRTRLRAYGMRPHAR